jgi:hypothetical protein
LALEQEDLEVDIAQQQKRLQEEQQPKEPETYELKDKIRLRKRILDLELNKAKLQEMGGGQEQPQAPMPEVASAPMDQSTPPAKVAFSVTPEGHKYDAARAAILEDAALKHLALSQEAGGVGYRDAEGKTQMGSILKALRGFGSGVPREPGAEHRHLAYVRAKHEAGSNAWNPMGGTLTPHPAEQGGSAWQYGKISKEVKEAADARFKQALCKEALSVGTMKAGLTGVAEAAKPLLQTAGQGLKGALGFGRQAASTVGGVVRREGMQQGLGALGRQATAGVARAGEWAAQNPGAAGVIGAGALGGTALGAGALGRATAPRQR